MVKEYNKKGAMELSLNLIIMLIIGLVILGLIITFVTKMMNQAQDDFTNNLNSAEKKMLEDVKNAPGNFVIMNKGGTEVIVKKGVSTKLFIKLRNTGTNELNLAPGNLGIESSSSFGTIGATDPHIDCYLTGDAGVVTEYYFKGAGATIPSGEQEAMVYEFGVKDSIPVGTYYLVCRAYNGDEELIKEIRKTVIIE